MYNKNMKRFLIFTLLIFFIQIAEAETYNIGVSIEHVPKALFGSWRVKAILDTTNSPTLFIPKSIDVWELSRINNTLKLNNPMNGANAEIAIQTVEDKIIVFSKKTPYDENKILTDTVTIRLENDKFSGINSLKLETFSLIDKKLLKTETANYKISGEKIAGENILHD